MEIKPAVCIQGEIAMSGDKSISHRLAMLGSIAAGRTIIHNFAASADCHSTLKCLARLGVPYAENERTVVIEGCGPAGLRPPNDTLDAENSGTTVRLLAGIVAGYPLQTTFIGDASLSHRPMKRVIEPLRQFGAKLDARDGNYLPMTIQGGRLKAIEYSLPVASAQVKSAVLLAGLQAAGKTRVIEPTPTRDHTEIALRQFGAELTAANGVIEIEGGQTLRGQTLTVPGDASSAAFFVAAALGAQQGRLRIQGVGLNPTRTGFIHLLEDMGGRISVDRLSIGDGELTGNLIVENSDLSGMEIRGQWIPNIIDEIPVLAVLGARTRHGIRIRDASELRAKESDRIRTVADNLRKLGVEVEEFADGLHVPGQQQIKGGIVDSHGDHRIAMAFAVAGLFATGPVKIENASCVDVSFPGFFELLKRVRD